MVLIRNCLFPCLLGILFISTVRLAGAQEPQGTSERPSRLLLIGQKKDSHPFATHEYMAGVRIVARVLQNQHAIQVTVVQADGPWAEGPELLDGADGAFLFLSEGARWLVDDPKRVAAFQRLTERRGALGCLHWGMGTKEAGPIDEFVRLFGGCHGGPDRKFQYGDYHVSLATSAHAVLNGIGPFDVHDEFYYQLKFPKNRDGHTTLLQARIDDVNYPVAWAWERPDHGRSFGFSGLHFHENWKRAEYARLVTQGILWTLNKSMPVAGIPIDLSESDFDLPGN